MKITLIVDDYHGGAGNIVQLLAKELNKNNDISIILTNKNSEPRYELDNIKVYDEKINILKGNRILGLYKSIKNLRKRLLLLKTELVISFLDNNNTLACLALWNRKNIPIIVSERSNPLKIFPKFTWNLLRRIAYKRANMVTVQFEAFKYFDKKRFLHKCEVIPNIVEKPNYLKKEWSSKKIKFVTFSRLAQIKRIDLMIQMFIKLVSKNQQDIELHIWGEGPERKKLNDLIVINHMENRIFLHGYSKNVHQELLKYDVYLMTSLQEGFPNSLCEAMAVGLPSISFRCHEGISELVENGRSGFSVQDGNEEEFINKMEVLINEEEKRKIMGKNAQKISKKFSKEKVLKQWEEYIKQVFSE